MINSTLSFSTEAAAAAAAAFLVKKPVSSKIRSRRPSLYVSSSSSSSSSSVDLDNDQSNAFFQILKNGHHHNNNNDHDHDHNEDYYAKLMEEHLSTECENLKRYIHDKESALSIATGALETNQDLVTALYEARRVMTVAEEKLDNTRVELAQAQHRIAQLEQQLFQKDAEVEELRSRFSRDQLKQYDVEGLSDIDGDNNSLLFGGDSIEIDEEVPELNDWYLDSDGAVCGTVSNHPQIDDGTTILTSPLLLLLEDEEEDNDNTAKMVAKENSIVTTSSGSKYRLKRPLSSHDVCDNDDNGDAIVVVGNDGKYLLVGKPRNSVAGRSQIWKAFRMDDDDDAHAHDIPKGEAPLIVKVSSNRLAMEREWENYQKVKKGFTTPLGLIVYPVEFLTPPKVAGNSISNSPSLPLLLEDKCALVMERGIYGDVKEYLARGRNDSGSGGLEGSALRQAALAAAQCTEVMHSSNLVWTDLKIENFVVVHQDNDDGQEEGDDDNDNNNNIQIKAIDLESAIERGGTPVDYSPESCPPEFAAAYLKGEDQQFVLDYNYDIWSFGTFLYELSTGRGPFEGMSPSEITNHLLTFQQTDDVLMKMVNDANTDANANANNILDDNGNLDLVHLLSQCLQVDPQKRPTIAEVLEHPFFSDV